MRPAKEEELLLNARRDSDTRAGSRPRNLPRVIVRQWLKQKHWRGHDRGQNVVEVMGNFLRPNLPGALSSSALEQLRMGALERLSCLAVPVTSRRKLG